MTDSVGSRYVGHGYQFKIPVCPRKRRLQQQQRLPQKAGVGVGAGADGAAGEVVDAVSAAAAQVIILPSLCLAARLVPLQHFLFATAAREGAFR